MEIHRGVTLAALLLALGLVLLVAFCAVVWWPAVLLALGVACTVTALLVDFDKLPGRRR